jgi:hypothetical protein
VCQKLARLKRKHGIEMHIAREWLQMIRASVLLCDAAYDKTWQSRFRLLQ